MDLPPSRRNPAQPIRLAFGSAPDGDAIFLSTDALGTPGRLNRWVLEALGLPLELPSQSELAARDPAGRAPALDQYARWISLTLRRPDMLRWLQWGADEAHWPPEELGTALVVRRLRALEHHAGAAPGPAAFHKALCRTLNLFDEKRTDWSCDARLFDFFQAEARREPGQRLSDAAARGFW